MSRREKTNKTFPENRDSNPIFRIPERHLMGKDKLGGCAKAKPLIWLILLPELSQL
jgi:hypothetical protein